METLWIALVIIAAVFALIILIGFIALFFFFAFAAVLPVFHLWNDSQNGS